MRFRWLLILLTLPPASRADTYLRQPAIDVVHYEIAVELEEGRETIAGVTRIHALMTRDEVSGMSLDLADMKVEKLLVGAKEQPFKHEGGKLSFDFDRRYNRNEIALLEVHYRGKPQDKGMLIGKNRFGRPVFFAENWPDLAHHWFPCIDHPADKATVDIAVTAPDKFEVVANGRLVETRSLFDGRRLTRWSESVPIPTYCMVIGVAEFSVLHANRVLDIPLTFYGYPQNADAVARKFARTNLIVQFFNELIGPYPYEKLAQVQSTTRIGGMENSSVIFYAEGSFQRESINEQPVPHEIAHQWFGDSITETDWDHLWISEGFATYFSALFYEHLEGGASLQREMTRSAEAVKQYHKTRPASIIDPELTDLNKKLNPFNYQKGAWTLHMLRKIVGDQIFFQGIRRYYNLYAGKNAATEDFQKVMESVSGKSLGYFFKEWFYQPGWPDYKVRWRWEEATREVEIDVHQAQTTGIFDMPLDISFTVGDKHELRSARISSQDQKLRFPLSSKPTKVEIDPDSWVLKSVEILNP